MTFGSKCTVSPFRSIEFIRGWTSQSPMRQSPRKVSTSCPDYKNKYRKLPARTPEASPMKRVTSGPRENLGKMSRCAPRQLYAALVSVSAVIE